MFKILCVEDSEDTILLLESALEGHHTVFARTVREALTFVNNVSFDLFLVDIELPDGTGLEFVARLPANLKEKPLLFLTGRQDFAAKVSAFSLGADDYVNKPFDPRELKLRVDSKLHKKATSSNPSRPFSIGNVLCSPQEQRITIKGNGAPIELTSLEFRIFRLLTGAPSRIFPREEILNKVWSDNVAVTDRTVDVHVSNLRKKLTGSNVKIETVIGAGYRIVVSEED
jgi:DNA-binding response OmpR family regulator